MKDTFSLTATGGTSSGRPSDLMWPSRSGMRSVPGTALRYAKWLDQPGLAHSLSVSSGVIPEERKSWDVPSSPCRAMTP